MKLFAQVLLVCILGLNCSQAEASLVVDVSSLPASAVGLSPINPFLQTSGQSFTTNATNLAGVRVVLSSGAASQVSVSLHDYSSLGTNPTPLAFSTVGPQSPGIVELLFSSPVAVTQGNSYFIAFSGGVGDSGFFAGTTTDSYSGGDALTNPNTSSVTVFDGVGGNPGPFDFSFETLTFSAVPEPSSLTLFAMAVVFCGAPRRRFQ